MKLNQRQSSMFKGITAEGPNKLNRKGNPLKFKKHRKKSARNLNHNAKSKKILSIKSNSKLRNQLASLRQSTRPVVNRNVSSDHKRGKKQKKKKNSALVQALQWNKAKSSKLSFGSLTKRSLLFSIEQIQKMDKITIYYIGKSGLAQLSELNDGFERYNETLFNEKRVLFGGSAMNKMMTFDRSANDNEKENEFIDNEVISLLRDLTDYFLLEEAHKVLEFLISHYKIHLNYPLFALECCFPYYSTVTFARFIQLIEFSHHKWQLLFLNVQKNLSPLNKDILVKQCSKDHSILQFIQQMHFKHNAKSQMVRQFYTEIVINILNTHQNELLLLQIMPCVLSNLHLSSAHMVLNFIASKVKLSASQTDEIIKTLVAQKINEKNLLTLDHIVDSSTSGSDDVIRLLLTLDHERMTQMWIKLSAKFNLKLPLLVTKYLIINQTHNANANGLLTALLTRYRFRKPHEMIICETVIDADRRDVMDILKHNRHYGESLNESLWGEQGAKIINNPQLIDYLISHDTLHYVLRSSLVYDNESITIAVVNKMESELKQKRLNAQQVTELLILVLATKAIAKRKTKTKERIIEMLFEHKSQLMNEENVLALTKSLCGLQLKLNPLRMCHLFELLCFGIQRIRDNGTITLSNCCIIDILSNAPQQCVSSLLNILSQYHCEKILICCSSERCTVDNLLQTIGDNMILNWKPFMRIMPYLSMQGVCLLLMCLKQVTHSMATNRLERISPTMIEMLLQISNHLSRGPGPKQKEVTALICSVFYWCVKNINDTEHMTWVLSLIENESKLLQIVVYAKGGIAMIKLLLKLLKLLQLSKRRKTKTKAQCLYLLSVLLRKEKYETTNKEELCNIVASLLFYLNGEHKVIRYCAVECFKSIYLNMNNGDSDRDSVKLLVAMVDEINGFETDILEDKQALNRMFCHSFLNLAAPIMKLFVDYQHIHCDMLALFVPLLLQKGSGLSNESLNEMSQRICQYLRANKHNMESTRWSRCVIEICKLNSLHCIPFEYIDEWISQHHIIGILPLLTGVYWSQLKFTQQKQLYLSLETLLEAQSPSQTQQIVEFILSVPLSANMIEYWLRKEKESMTITTRIQFIISKVNNETIDKDMMNGVLIPLMMSLLKETHLGMQQSKHTQLQLQSLNWLRSIVLSALIGMIDCVGVTIDSKSIDIDVLLKCMQYEWLFANNLFIQLICVLGKYVPTLLLRIYVAFIEFMTSNAKKAETRDVVFVSLLSEFFESTIAFIAPLLKVKELKRIIVSSMALLNELCDGDLELQYISKLLKSFVAAQQESAVLIAFDIMYCNKSNYAMKDMNRLLFNATSHKIDLQLKIILNILNSNRNSSNRKQFLEMIEHHLNHSIFIKELSLIVLENNDEIPSKMDALNSKIFKRLFDDLLATNDGSTALVIYKCLDAVRGLLSLNSFAFIIKDLLMATKNKKKRMKSMQLLLDQMQQNSEKFKLNHVKYYLKQLIIPLYDEMQKGETHDVEMNQNIICILELTIKKFHNYLVVNEWFATVISSVILRLENKNENKVIIAHLMLLLSTSMRTLRSNNYKSLFLTHFSALLRINLNILKSEKENELLMISSAFCLECIVSEYNDYIGGYLEEIVSCILSEEYMKLNLKLYHRSTMHHIASFESIQLMKCLQNTFDCLVDALDATSFEAYFNIISLMMMRWKTRQETLQCYKHLFDLFKHCMDNEEVMDKFEFIVLKCFSDLVLKLTDKEMMTIMEELIFWIEEFEMNSVRYNIRTLSLFRLLCHCLRRFTKAFCGVALFSYNLAVKCLMTSEQEPPKKKQKTNENENEKLLRQRRRSNYIMETIQLTLKYGREDKLIDKATFLMLLPVIVDEIRCGMAWRDEIMYIAYFEKYITPTLVCLANTTKDINLWNQLNKHILALCGHKKRMIRSAAVDALLGLFSLMGHAWLNCLPQTLHYINELLQDEDEDVLQRTKSLVQTIELLTQSKLNNLT